MRMIKTIAALGLAGALSLGVSAPSMAQGFQFYAPGFTFGIGPNYSPPVYGYSAPYRSYGYSEPYAYRYEPYAAYGYAGPRYRYRSRNHWNSSAE